MSHTEQSQELNKLLADVIAIRRAAPKEYERKLQKYYAERANDMKHGIFDGNKLPEVQLDVGNLREHLQENRELTQKANNNAQQYLCMKSGNDRLNAELKDLAETLQKAKEINQAIRNDGMQCP